MDQIPPAFPVWLAVLLCAWLAAGLAVYLRAAWRVSGGRGKVSTIEFKEKDLWVCVGFVTWFGLTIGGSFGGRQRDVTQTEIIENAALYLGIVAILFSFMQYRGINPLRQFGLLGRNPFPGAAMALGLVLAAFPLVLVTEGLTTWAMHGAAQPQNLVEFFLNASEKSNERAVWVTMVLAVFVAPAAEETIFRGYIYGVLKRYIGGVGAGLFSAGLFAAAHMNVAALPPLFVLALCLTLAYEATGSLLVNIFMHGLFNLSMLLVMLYVVQHSAAP